MAELADAHGSGPCGSNTMRVQVSFPALNRNLGIPAKWNSGVISYYLSLTAVLGKKELTLRSIPKNASHSFLATYNAVA